MSENWTDKIEAIIREEAQAAHIRVTELLSRRRARNLVLARQRAYWRAFHETTASLPSIGRHMGMRDHSTIMHGIRRHEARMHGGDQASVQLKVASRSAATTR